ncbi:hypothetical protein A3H65_00215 [Candidatus Giovannonibacteria bacterium RIFCSPLOWO2_02_FULL_45_14]|uniref:Uncharacterized protein n=1 Tax=Candidatus Giovannonibacteria bacterium RIFCSPLOWO2_12_FULL_44_15 TaxID=1798364 RepID=A0A1F5Y1A8_9BACT|nr:MAG: hypothetical protein A3C75_02185 [Candidatus Giovannonibacteria bacterium RIFCSPHIGHO2_02_FULL_44_31]OGF76244.1 MAG: hypothetical protein A3E62_03880 [Candidatus Giovannonibacteria bacterium RIFCSPHIGHO2_12_FULL_44_29]OGF91140.1 MAG: hypothetical protein A3H65_00215 [Candidatus Giovannonibacteria bacterium RIFCSPLOWO2_02_FULL_45_14]OGF93601.1 MAG: hypothetical protein A3G54_03385 [Candidatus Giovannonibacteria bacterium RIFCSPLOWO2_12_FULL_44_15]
MVRTKRKHKLAIRLSISAAAAFFIVGVVFATITVPNFEALDSKNIVQSTKIYDRTGEVLLYDVHGDIKRTVIPFDKIPAHLKEAVISMEDQNFYRHFGISPTSIVRAIFVNVFSGKFSQGGSTITQQLVKNTFLTPEKTITRKIKEWVLAIKVESKYTKNEILGFYLNQVPFGSNAYGIEAASQNYFDKHAENLDIAEAAYLAGMLQAPTRYSPYGSHRDELEVRKNIVLSRLFDKNQITKEEFDSAKNEQVKFAVKAVGGIKAPHFSLFVKEYLVEKYGEDVVERGGLKVTTTVNWQWQEKFEELLRTRSAENEKNFSAYNAGLVAIDPKTGQIMAMVGSRDYFSNPLPEGCTPGVNCKFDPQVNMTLRSRQPGSSFKPVVYATAFSKGYAPSTSLFDLKTEFSAYCSPYSVPDPGVDPEKCYHPENFDNKFRGPVSLRDALAQSVNVVAVKVLYLAGLADSLKMARNLGITTLTDPDRYGLTLVLGGGEVKPLELTNAYSAFANGGYYIPYAPILKVESPDGSVLEEYSENKTQALDPSIAREISDILSDNAARTPAFTENSALYIPERPVAVKTGTTEDTRDTWVIGYTPNIVIGVWAGNNDNSKMERKVAGLIVAPIWNSAMHLIFDELPTENFEKPAVPEPEKAVLRGEWRGGRIYKIDKMSGKLATEFTPEELIEKRVVPEVHSILYWVNKSDPLGPPPQNPSSDPQFKNWETTVRDWAAARGLFDRGDDVIPRESDDIHLPEYSPKGEIIIDPPGDSFPNGARITALVNAEARFQIEQVDVFINSEYGGSYKAAPYEFPVDVLGSPGQEIKITAVIYDYAKNKTEVEKIIRVSGN